VQQAPFFSFFCFYINMTSKKGFTKDNAISDIIQKLNEIESLMKSLIISYIQPEKSKKQFMEAYLLHSTIINFGSKLKIIKQINANQKWFSSKDFENFHKLINIRNAFAHSTTHDMEGFASFPLTFPIVFQVYVEQSKSSKIFELKPMKEQYETFNEIFDNLKSKLESIIKNQNSPDSNSSEA